MAALNVDYFAWIITVLGAINSNLTFIFDLNYFLWKLKISKRQGVSSLLGKKHKVFRCGFIARFPSNLQLGPFKDKKNLSYQNQMYIRN